MSIEDLEGLVEEIARLKATTRRATSTAGRRLSALPNLVGPDEPTERRRGGALPDLLAPSIVDVASKVHPAFIEAEKRQQTGRGPLQILFDILSIGNYTVAGGAKGLVEGGPLGLLQGAAGGFAAGLTGDGRTTWTDVFQAAGWEEPDGVAAKIARGALGFALDVFADPTTYLTFGVSKAGTVVRGAENVLGAVSKLTLAKPGRKMVANLMVDLTKSEKITDAVEASKRVHEYLRPFVALEPMGKHIPLDQVFRVRPKANVERILKSAGMTVTPENVELVARRGLLPLADEGGIKWMGRMYIRSRTANAAKAHIDEAISRGITQPIIAAGSALLRPITESKWASAMRANIVPWKSLVGSTVGPKFMRAFGAPEDFARVERLHVAEDFRIIRESLGEVDRGLLVTKADGSLRVPTRKELRDMQRALHDASYYANAKSPAFSLDKASEAIEALPPHLRGVTYRIRAMLDELDTLELKHHIREASIRQYFPQMWEKDAWGKIHRSILSGELTADTFNWMAKERHVLMPFDEAVKHGLMTDLRAVLSSRIISGRRMANMQGFIQTVADRWGHQFIKAVEGTVEKTGPFKDLMSDILSGIKRIPGELVAGNPAKSSLLQRALGRLSMGEVEEGLADLGKARVQLTGTQIEAIRPTILSALRNARRLADEAAADAEASLIEVPERIMARRDALADPEAIATKVLGTLQKNSVEAELRNVARRKVEFPSLMKTMAPGSESRFAAEVKARATEHLAAQRDALVRKLPGTLSSHSDRKRLIAEINAEMAKVRATSIERPTLVKTIEGLPTLMEEGIDRFGARLEKLGFPGEEVQPFLRDLKDKARGAVDFRRAWDMTRIPWRRYQLGRVNPADPDAVGVVRSSLDEMHRLSSGLAEREVAYRKTEEVFAERMKAANFADLPHPALRQNLFDLRRLQAERDMILFQKRVIPRAEEIAAYREAIEGKLKATQGWADNVSPTTGLTIRVPVTGTQAHALLRILGKPSKDLRALQENLPEAIQAITRKERIEELTMEEAREVFEMLRRKPATVSQARFAGERLGATGSEKLVPFPAVRWTKVKIGVDEWVDPAKTITIPENIANAVARDLTPIRHDNLVSHVLRAFDWIQDPLKWSWTGPWPAFHARNMMETAARYVFQLGIQAADPHMMKTVLRTWAGSKAPIELRNGLTVLPESIRIALQEEGVLKQLPSRMEFISGSPEKAVENILTAIAGPFAGMSKAREAIRYGQWKLAAAMETRPVGKFLKKFSMSKVSAGFEDAAAIGYVAKRLEAGWTLEQAAKSAADGFFTYQMLTNFEKEYLRRLIPFYSYYRQAIPWTWRQLKEHPGMLGMFGKMRFFGGTDADVGPFVPDFIKDNIRIRIPSDGAPQWAVFRNIFTLDWLADYNLDDAPGFLRSIGGHLSPLLTAPAQLALGRDLFLGREIQERQILRKAMSDAPYLAPVYAWVRARPMKIGGQDFMAVDGRRMWALRTFFFSRMYSYLELLARQDLMPVQKLTQMATGVMMARIDMERRRQILVGRAASFQADFLRAVKRGDDVRANDIMEVLSGD